MTTINSYSSIVAEGTNRADRTMVNDYLEQTLRQIPSTFGRMVHAASLWDPVVGMYRHHPLCERVSPRIVDIVVGEIHLEIFRQWLALGLLQQRGDLVRYLDLDDTRSSNVIRRWHEGGIFKHLTPAYALRHECDLFTNDLTMVMHSLRSDPAFG